MKKIILFSIAIFIFSACSDNDDVPTSNSSKQVDWSALKHISKTNSSDIQEDDMIEEEDEFVEKKVEPIPSFEDSKKELASKEDKGIVEKVEDEDFKQYSSEYKKELETQMEKALANYPTPPIPANLTPYDSRESSSYREPTKAESTSGSGEFPPMPPTVYINQ